MYKDTVFPLVNESIYAGPPSTRGDAAWEKLLYPQVIRVAKGEFTRQWDNPVKLQEGPGFSSSMSVYHEMHCVVCSILFHTGLLDKTDSMAALLTTICVF